MNLIELAFTAPHIGIRRRWPNVLHAIDMDGLPFATWPEGLCKSVCGKSSLRIIQASDGGPAQWPPYVKGLGQKTRCKKCFDLCKQKRPKSQFKAKL